MKKRRITIVAFVLCAALVMGIGYAAVTGQLNITGTATFNGTGEVSTNVHNAVKFTDAKVVSTSADSVTGIATKSNDDNCDLVVTIQDSDGTAASFSLVAEFTIKYETEDTTLPDITFSKPVVTLGKPDVGFTVVTAWKDIATETATLTPGDSVVMTVTVTFTPDTVQRETDQVVSTITIPMPYASVAASTNP